MSPIRIVIAISITASITVTAFFVFSYVIQFLQPSPVIIYKGMPDKFGILAIYATKQGGREWFIDMENPNDGTLSPGSEIERQDDGSWQIGMNRSGGKYEQVRMNVGTPSGSAEWKNVEITGYAKVLLATDDDDSLVWYARGNRHNDRVPCEGTSLKGGISADGTVSWVKEIWHTGGYTDEREKKKATDSILGRWIGWKVAIYNIGKVEGKAVKMESYLDDNAENKWVKVADLVDAGGWNANSRDSTFYGAVCGRARDYVITNSGKVVTFRSDNMVWDFQNMSVREIQAP
jgi:hypothetical protein